MKIVAYRVFGADNDSFYYDKAPPKFFCQKCDCVIDESYVPENIGRIRSRYPFSYTYDHQAIVNEEFRCFCLEHAPSGIDFIRVKSNQNLYVMQVSRIVAFDAEKRRTVFDEPCEVCGQSPEIIGSSPGVLKEIDTALGYYFYRTDIKFGYKRSKGYGIMVGPELRHAMGKHKFKSMHFDPVFGASTSYEEMIARQGS